MAVEQSSSGSLQFPHHLLPHMPLLHSNLIPVTPSSTISRFNPASLFPHPSTRHTSSPLSACNASFFWMRLLSPQPPPYTFIHFTAPVPLPFLPVFALFPENDSVPEATARECSAATPAIFTNHSDLSYSQRSQSPDPTPRRSKAVLASQKMDRCIGAQQWQQSRNKPASITDN